MLTRRLGRSGPLVSALGLGCMGMSDFYGPADEGESIATVHAALDAGVTLLDSGDFYGMGHNEMLLSRALAGRPRDSYVLSVKFGAQRTPAGQFIGIDSRPAAVKTALAYSLKRLGTDYIDIYRPARLDPAVPIEETAGAVAEMIEAGYVRHLGLSEMSADTVRRANAVTPVVDLQIEYGLLTRTIEARTLPGLRELGVGLTAYGVLSRGLLSDNRPSGDRRDDFRTHSPRFQGDNYRRNLSLVEAVGEIARAKGATVAQVAIAWALSRGGDIVPLVGARRPERLAESLKALDLTLTAEDVAALEAAAPPAAVAGERYDAHQMTTLDSERDRIQ